MPLAMPPTVDVDDLVHHHLPARSLLWRVMRREHIDRASLFNPRQAPPDTEPDDQTAYGRFDATCEDPYGYCYAALDDLTAFAETLLRDVPFTNRVRAIQLKQVWGRSLALYETLAPLRLVALTTSAELARAWQDPWLIQADADEYAQTRRWGHWLRVCSPVAHGFVWPSRRNPGGRCVVLFDDRGTRERLSLTPVVQRPLDGSGGLELLNGRLADLNTCIDVDAASWLEREGVS